MGKAVIWIIVIVVVIVAFAVFYPWGGVKAPVVGQPPTGGTTAVATGNPDAIVSNLLSDSANTPATPAETDQTLTTSNDSAVSGFDQTLNTSQF